MKKVTVYLMLAKKSFNMGANPTEQQNVNVSKQDTPAKPNKPSKVNKPSKPAKPGEKNNYNNNHPDSNHKSSI